MNEQSKTIRSETMPKTANSQFSEEREQIIMDFLHKQAEFRPRLFSFVLHLQNNIWFRLHVILLYTSKLLYTLLYEY